MLGLIGCELRGVVFVLVSYGDSCLELRLYNLCVLFSYSFLCVLVESCGGSDTARAAEQSGDMAPSSAHPAEFSKSEYQVFRITGANTLHVLLYICLRYKFFSRSQWIGFKFGQYWMLFDGV